jgi:hypothetical protein
MSIQTTAVLRRSRAAPQRRGPSWERVRRVALVIWAALWDRDAWTPPVDRVANHPEFWFRII